MPRIGNHIMTFTRGEVTPLVQSRIDLQDYQMSLATCQNFMVSKYGGVTRVPGTLYFGATKSGGTARLIPFVFNQDQVYGIEFSNQYIRFWDEDGQIESGGSPYEIASPYLAADLWKIQFVTIGDVMYLACDGYEPRQLIRYADDSWTLSTFASVDGPWLPMWTEGTVLVPAGTGDMIPNMTGLTAPSGTVTSSGSFTDAWEMFSWDEENQTEIASSETEWVSYDFGAGVEKTAIAYSFLGTTSGDNAPNVPISWVIEGQVDGGTEWVTLDSQQNISDWLAGETRVYEISNTTAYRYYRFRIVGGGDTGGVGSGLTVIGTVKFLLAEDEQTAFNLVASAATGINGGTGFTADDVGRLIRIMCDDGFWRVLKIISRTDSTTVTVKVLGPAPIPADTESVSLWQLQAWGDEPAWPTAVFKHKGRLGWARTDTEPRTVWLSRSADYDNYGTAQPLLDDDAITATFADGEMDEVLWATSNGDDLLAGTVGGIRVLSSRSTNEVFSPSNVEEAGSTETRAGSVHPVWSNRIMIFPNKQLNRLFETAFSLDEGGYVTRELTMLAEHIFREGVKELHYQQAPDPAIWVVLDNGEAAVCTYDRQQQVFGVGRVVIPGTDATISSMCILPSPDYDVPLLVVQRTVNSVASYSVEKMLDPFRAGGLSSFTLPVYLMSAISYSGMPTTAISGLGHLEGETVAVLKTGANGTFIDLGDATVSSGSITIPGSVLTTTAIVGLRYTSTLQTLPPPNVPEDGRYLGRHAVPYRVAVDVMETYGLYGGGAQHTELLRTEADVHQSGTSRALHTGVLEVPIDEGWSIEPSVKLTTDSAFPATIRAMMVELDRGD